MKKILILGLFLLLLPLAYAEEQEGNEICNYAMDELNVYEGRFVPSGIPFSNEIFDAYDMEGNPLGHIKIEDKKITEVSCTTVNESTYNIYLKDLQTLKDIKASEHKLDTLDDKLGKEIIVEGTSIGKSVKLFFSKFGLKVGSWFS